MYSCHSFGFASIAPCYAKHLTAESAKFTIQPMREHIYPPLIFFGWLFLAGWVIKETHADEKWFLLAFFGPIILTAAYIKQNQDKD